MQSNPLRSTWRLLPALALLLFVFGCSSDMIPSTAPETQTESETLNESVLYPSWTEEELAALLPGYTIIGVDERAYAAEEQLDDQSSRYIRRFIGGSVSHRNCGVQIGPWQLWDDELVTVSTPYRHSAICDFYPHPYNFNGHIRIWIDLTYLELPEGMNWWDIQMFYIHDDGTLEPYNGYVDQVANQYVAWTNHFSRYILATRTND